MNCIFGVVRIIHLNSYAGNGGAGRACLRLNKALKAEGLDSVLAINFLFKDNPGPSIYPKAFSINGLQYLESLSSDIILSSLPSHCRYLFHFRYGVEMSQSLNYFVQLILFICTGSIMHS